MEIWLHDDPFATYSFQDTEIPRPYFANACTPAGNKITRNHPPQPEDPQDHEKMHPGIWLAFGDLSGADSWRLSAPVEHVRFVQEPVIHGDMLTFVVENSYLTAARSEICRERCEYALHALSRGVLILCDSTFRSDDNPFAFGDQEELGLGVRLNRAVAVSSGQGGRILNSNGQREEEEAWGQQADWCDYTGVVGDERVGIMIMPHPENFRKAWCHCRDNGFMAMNPFGRKSFTGGTESKIEVGKDADFRLRYGVLVHWDGSATKFDPTAAYSQFLKIIGSR